MITFERKGLILQTDAELILIFVRAFPLLLKYCNRRLTNMRTD